MANYVGGVREGTQTLVVLPPNQLTADDPDGNTATVLLLWGKQSSDPVKRAET